MPAARLLLLKLVTLLACRCNELTFTSFVVSQPYVVTLAVVLVLVETRKNIIYVNCLLFPPRHQHVYILIDALGIMCVNTLQYFEADELMLPKAQLLEKETVQAAVKEKIDLLREIAAQVARTEEMEHLLEEERETVHAANKEKEHVQRTSLRASEVKEIR